jgi:hypothetical protein
VEGFFRQQQAEAAASHWQLIQLAPTDHPGKSVAEFVMGAPECRQTVTALTALLDVPTAPAKLTMLLLTAP